MTRFWAFFVCLALLTSFVIGPASAQAPPYGYPPAQPNYSSTDQNNYSENPEQAYSDAYTQLIEKAEQAQQTSQYSVAITALEQALPMAPSDALGTLHNNLAALYMERGNVLHNRYKQDDEALNDFRRAHYYLFEAWPEGLTLKPLYETNRQISQENLTIFYQNRGVPLKDVASHLNLAQQFRTNRKLIEAIVEYGQVVALSPRNVDALKALTELFNVLNQPEKSKKYAVSLVSAVQSINKTGPTLAEALFQLAVAQYKTGEPERAISNLDKALVAHPAHSGAATLLETLWRKELQENPRNTVAAANLASALQKQNRFAEAAQLYDLAEGLANADPSVSLAIKKQIRFNRALLFHQTHQYDMALRAYDSLLELDSADESYLQGKADVLLAMGLPEQAQAIYRQLLFKHPADMALHQAYWDLLGKNLATLPEQARVYAQQFSNVFWTQATVGEYFHQQKDYPTALGYYQAAMALNPQSASVLANMGALYQAQKNVPKAQEAYAKAKAIEPTGSALAQKIQAQLNALQQSQQQDYLSQATALQAQAKHEQAILAYEQLLRETPPSNAADKAQVYDAIGASQQALQAYTKAVVAYKQAVALDAANADYTYNLATAYQQAGQVAEAKAMYQKTVMLAGEQAQFSQSKAEAQQVLAQWQATDRQQEIARLEASLETLYDKGQRQAVLTQTQVLLAKDANNIAAHYYQGMVYADLKQWAKAEAAYRRVLQLDETRAEAAYALGVLLDEHGRSTEAKVFYQQYVALSEKSGQGDPSVLLFIADRLKAIP